MFDIGFWEIAIIGVVGLVVIGPERLPDVARTLGRWVGAMRRFVGNVKADIDRELQQEELKKALERDAGLDEIKEIMKTDRFTLEEEIKFDEEPDDLVKAIEDIDQKAAYQKARQQAAEDKQQAAESSDADEATSNEKDK